MKQSLPLYSSLGPLPASRGDRALPFAVLSLHSHEDRSFLDDVVLHHLAGGLRASGLSGDLVVAYLPRDDDDGGAWSALIAVLSRYPTIIYERVWSAALTARLRADLPDAVLIQLVGEHELDGAVADHVCRRVSDVYAALFALSGRAPAPAPSAYTPNLRPIYATARSRPKAVSFPIMGNVGCPHQDDARDNPLFAGAGLPDGMGRGCSFCTTGNHYEHKPKARAIEHALTQLRYLREHAPEIQVLVLRDQNPFYYLTELVEAAEQERLGPFSLLLESRADWFLQNSARFVRAMESAKRSSITLCPFLVGIESFSQAELDRFNKNMDAGTNVRFVETLWSWTEQHAPAIDLSHAAFGFILLTPWTTMDDLRVNLAAIRQTKMHELRGHLLLSRARLYPDTALYHLAARDDLLATAYERQGDDNSARYGYLPATPWRFRDPKVARVAELGAELTVRPGGRDEPALIAALIAAVDAAADPSKVTLADVERELPKARAPIGTTPTDARELMMAATSAARGGRLATARRNMARALESAPTDALVRTLAGIVAFVTRDYAESLEHLWEAARLDPSSAPRLYQMAAEHAGRLGWDRDQLQAIDAWIAASSGDPRAHVAAARLHLVRRNWQGAVAHLDAALARVPNAPELHVERARALLELGRHDDAAAAVGLAHGLDASFGFQLEAGHLLRAAGRFEEAATRFERARALDGTQAAPAVALAELAAFRGDAATARREVAEALSLDDGCGAALRVDGALHAWAGEHEIAEGLLRRALAAVPSDAEAHAWLGEIAIARADWKLAEVELNQAVAKAGGYSFAALVLRALATVTEAAAKEPGARCAFANFQEIAEAVELLEPGATTVFEAGHAAACRDLLASVLKMLGCNRSTCTTYLHDGTLRLLPRLPGVRFRSRHALQLFRLLGLDHVRALLEAEAARDPRRSLPLCHLGEAELWAGELDQARATLERTLAVSPVTRWAWIGLTAVEALSGHPARGIEVSAKGVEQMWGTVGPALYVHRGDAHRLAGNLAEARADLEQAVALHPRRVSARICLALVLSTLGETTLVAEEFARIAEAAPGLVSDAARETGIPVWGDPGESPTHAARVRVLERALQMMRGNRSASAITYFTVDGRLRACDFGARRGELHARDAAALDRAAAIAAGVRRHRSTSLRAS